MNEKIISNKKCRVILVEDSLDDVNLFRLIAEREGFKLEVTHFSDGELAMDFLDALVLQNIPFKGHILILDLNLPKINGKEILFRLKQEKKSDLLYTIVFSGSENPDDKNDCLDLGARAFYVKPQNFKDYHDFFKGPLQFELKQACPAQG